MWNLARNANDCTYLHLKQTVLKFAVHMHCMPMAIGRKKNQLPRWNFARFLSRIAMLVYFIQCLSPGFDKYRNASFPSPPPSCAGLSSGTAHLENLHRSAPGLVSTRKLRGSQLLSPHGYWPARQLRKITGNLSTLTKTHLPENPSTEEQMDLLFHIKK